MTAYSVLIPFTPRRPELVLPYAAMVHWTRAHRLWQGQSLLVEPYQGFAHAAGAGFRVPTGIGVTLMPLRHPYEAAAQMRSLALATGESVLAGFGPGAKPFQRSLLGAPYASPLGAAREYLTIVRGLLAGEEVNLQGRFCTCQGRLPLSPAPAVEVGLGVLRSGMARLAGELADAAITWLAPARYVREAIRPAMCEAAEAAGRPPPWLTAIVPLALTRPDRDMAAVALASNAAHLRGLHYVDMLYRADIDASGSDPTVNARALIDGGAFLAGDLSELIGQLREYQDAGVDEVVLNLTGVFNLYGPQAALDELKTLLAALV